MSNRESLLEKDGANYRDSSLSFQTEPRMGDATGRGRHSEGMDCEYSH